MNSADILSNAKVSVIVPNYNYAHFLNETVSSVLSQTYSNLECIIVDDGSTDNSIEVISELQKKDARVKAIFKKNGGLSSARNAGLKASAGDFVAYLDSDDLWEINKLENQMACFKTFPKADFVFSNYIGFYPDGTTEKFNHIYGDIHWIDFIGQNPIAGSASSALHTKKLYIKVGEFNESLASSEDLEYWFRCKLHGAVFKYCNSDDVKIRLHYESMSQNFARMAQSNFIVLKFILDHFPMKEIKNNRIEFWERVFKRLQSILWLARNSKNFTLIFNTYKLSLAYIFKTSKAFAYIYSNIKYDIALRKSAI